MKKLVALILITISTSALADTCVDGYYRQDGTWVESYCRSNSNNTTFDNYGTKGNTNPYTGKKGTYNGF